MTKNKGTVLVVEADALLNQFVSDLVRANGGTALTADNADEAMKILASNPDIALLITNVVMGGSMNGVELAHAVDRRWPRVWVIVVSGLTGLSETEFPQRCLFMLKPYHDNELAFEIRARMDLAVRDGLASDDAQA